MSAALAKSTIVTADRSVAPDETSGVFESMSGPSGLGIEVSRTAGHREPLFLTVEGLPDLNRCTFVGVNQALGWVASD